MQKKLLFIFFLNQKMFYQLFLTAVAVGICVYQIFWGKTRRTITPADRIPFPHTHFNNVSRFYDVGPMLADVRARKIVMSTLQTIVREHSPRLIIGLNSSPFGAIVAEKLNVPFASASRIGRLPGNVLRGTTLEIVDLENFMDDMPTIVIVDEFMATGKTIDDLIDLLVQTYGERINIVACVSLIELDAFKKEQSALKNKHPNVHFESIFTETVINKNRNPFAPD